MIFIQQEAQKVSKEEKNKQREIHATKGKKKPKIYEKAIICDKNRWSVNLKGKKPRLAKKEQRIEKSWEIEFFFACDYEQYVINNNRRTTRCKFVHAFSCWPFKLIRNVAGKRENLVRLVTGIVINSMWYRVSNIFANATKIHKRATVCIDR